jgi:hypothetical protein
MPTVRSKIHARDARKIRFAFSGESISGIIVDTVAAGSDGENDPALGRRGTGRPGLCRHLRSLCRGRSLVQARQKSQEEAPELDAVIRGQPARLGVEKARANPIGSCVKMREDA